MTPQRLVLYDVDLRHSHEFIENDVVVRLFSDVFYPSHGSDEGLKTSFAGK